MTKFCGALNALKIAYDSISQFSKHSLVNYYNLFCLNILGAAGHSEKFPLAIPSY